MIFQCLIQRLRCYSNSYYVQITSLTIFRECLMCTPIILHLKVYLWTAIGKYVKPRAKSSYRPCNSGKLWTNSLPPSLPPTHRIIAGLKT